MNFRKIPAIVIAIMVASTNLSAAEADYNVVPMPLSVTVDAAQQPFVLGSDTRVVTTKALDREGDFLREYISALPKAGAKGVISLDSKLKSDNPEAYTITVTPGKITVSGASAAGVFYGLQTLRKSLPANLDEPVEMPAAVVSDAPRFAYRGAHLDVVRHFFDADQVKTFIDMLALHNINKFHWHLTDDQGWRIEIKKYPRLTEVGSKRKGTLIGRYGAGETIDSIPVEGYFTQDQLRDIIAYASDRHIEIIPEIDLPSHMMAALASYPELGCTGGPYEVLTTWAGYKDVLCPGKDKTMTFIADVLTEVMELFPSKYIHIGGDECPKDRWKECTDCQARIKQLGITPTDKASAEDLLQGYVTAFAADVARKAGKSIIGWDEILECDVPQDAVVMSWRGIKGAVNGTARGHRVIQTPNDYLYFDYYQSDNAAAEPLAIGGYIPVSRVYSFEPLTEEMSDEQKSLVMGPQANLWTEYVPTFSHLQYMELPRLAALAEVQWTAPDKKDYHSFKCRTPRLFAIYDRNGYNYATHIKDTDVSFRPDRQKHALEMKASVYPGHQLRYTLDGTVPDAASPLYSEPLLLDKDCVVTAASFAPDGTRGTVVSDTLRISKASFAECTLAYKPYSPFAFGGADALVDGLCGDDNFRSGRWVGFLGDPCDVTITLPEPTEISQVGFKTCIVWPEGALEMSRAEVYGSADGKDFTLLATVDNPEQDPAQKNGAYAHTITFDPFKAKAVRVVVKPCAPAGIWSRIIFVDDIAVK